MTGSGPRRFTRTWLPWIPLVLVVVVALVVGATGETVPATTEARVQALADSLACPVCDGESVAESQVEVSRAIRVEIARRVEAGESDEEILLAIDSQFEEPLLLTPPSSGVAGLVWILPVVALVAGLAGVAAAFRRWQRQPAVHATDADRALVADALRGEAEAGATTPAAGGTGPAGDADVGEGSGR